MEFKIQRGPIMNSTDLLSLKNHLRTVISGSETIETLWTTCLKTIKEMNFDYFSYHIQYPTPFANPKIYTYGNYPLDASHLFTRNNPHRTTGQFKINSEIVKSLNQSPCQKNSQAINLNDSIYFITQSIQKKEGIRENFLLARAHYEIGSFELKISRTLIIIIMEEIHNKLCSLNNATSKIPTLSPREKEILLWGADGKTSEEIAIILGLSQDSINFHHKTIQKKLGTTNRAQAIAHAIVKGYI